MDLQLTNKLALVSGSTKGIGLAIAKYLAKACKARLVLTKKSSFPKKAEWRRRLAARQKRFWW